MFIQQYKILAGALMSALVVIAFALWFILSPAGGVLVAPPLTVLGAQVLAGILVASFCESFGYRLQPIAPGTPRKEASTQALARWQTGMMLRFAASEVMAIGSLAAAFAIPKGGFVAYVVGALIGGILIAVHAFPWARPVNKTQEALERAGGQSYLRELFGLEPWTGTDEDKPAWSVSQPRT